MPLQRGKNKLFIFLMIIEMAALGGVVWWVAGRFALQEISWFLCFMGYPGLFIGFYGAILYLYNHEFQ